MVDMVQTVALSAELVVEQPLEVALPLFTAEGERAWVPGWSPRFPGGDRMEEGVVFVTDQGDRTTVWVIVQRKDVSVRYARVTPMFTAGMVTVTAIDAQPDRTTFRVAYELTALSQDAEDWLETFASGFPQFITSWERAVHAANMSRC